MWPRSRRPGLKTPHGVLGILSLGRLTPTPFTSDELGWVAQIAEQIALALENALAFGAIASLRDRLARENIYLEDFGQPRSRRDGCQTGIPFGPGLPAERLSNPDSAAAGTHRGHSATSRIGSRKGWPIESVSRESMEMLCRWPWPGNIRELQNVIDRAVIPSHGTVLTVQEIVGHQRRGEIDRRESLPLRLTEPGFEDPCRRGDVCGGHDRVRPESPGRFPVLRSMRSR
jgi:transcriptional regulator with GAF, ATPase, and Fis domain